MSQTQGYDKCNNFTHPLCPRNDEEQFKTLAVATAICQKGSERLTQQMNDELDAARSERAESGMLPNARLDAIRDTYRQKRFDRIQDEATGKPGAVVAAILAFVPHMMNDELAAVQAEWVACGMLPNESLKARLQAIRDKYSTIKSFETAKFSFDKEMEEINKICELCTNFKPLPTRN